MAELVQICSPEWDSMNHEQRRPYKETAEQMANGNHEPKFANPQASIEESAPAQLSGKFDAFGRSFLALQKNRKNDKGKNNLENSVI